MSKIKEGDKVRVVSVPSEDVAPEMKALIGTVVVILEIRESQYESERDGLYRWYWNKENLELVVKESKELKRAKKLHKVAGDKMKQALALEYGIEHFEVEIEEQPVELEYVDSFEELKTAERRILIPTIPFHLREPMVAFCKLLSLMEQEYFNGDWKPDWSDEYNKFAIAVYEDKFTLGYRKLYKCHLVFQTMYKRDKFFEVYRDLIEVAKPLL